MTKPNHQSSHNAPSDGDFASYIEQLNSTQATAATPLEPEVAKQPTDFVQATPPIWQKDRTEFFTLLLPLQSYLRPARQVLMGLIALQILAYVLFSGGSFFGIFVLALLWWGLGRLGQKLLHLAPAEDTANMDPEDFKQGIHRLLTQLKSLQKK